MAEGAERLDWPVHSAACAACEAREVRASELDVDKGVYLWVSLPSDAPIDHYLPGG